MTTQATLDIPQTMGEDARKWLEQEGLTAKTPSCHSSDFELCVSTPFNYYLSRRLGIVPALSYSPALSRGGWFHRCFEAPDPTRVEPFITEQLMLRLAELKVLCPTLGMSDETTAHTLSNEREDAYTALGWFCAAQQVRFPISNTRTATISEYLGSLRTLGCEVALSIEEKDFEGMPLVCIIDRLLYNPNTHEIWIVDYKTTADPTPIRLLTCPIEFQTEHYMMIVQRLIEHGTLYKLFNLSQQIDLILGGMIHVAVQKPTIRFGQKDRPLLRYESEGKKTKTYGVVTFEEGKWHAMVSRVGGTSGEAILDSTYDKEEEALAALHEVTGKKPTAVYAGEPSLANYIARCRDWMMGEGEYLDKKPERAANPIVNFSSISGKIVLDLAWRQRYYDKVALVYDAATRPAIPAHFPQTVRHLARRGEASPYLPFYLTPVHHWPEVIERERFLTGRDRDDNLTFNTQVTP